MTDTVLCGFYILQQLVEECAETRDLRTLALRSMPTQFMAALLAPGSEFLPH